MRKIALVSHENLLDLSKNDQILQRCFQDRKIKTEILAWNDMLVNWEQFDSVVIRSTWDYYLNINEYKKWLSQFKKMSCQLVNSPSLVLANLHKNYLVDLKRCGMSVVPSYLINDNNMNDIGLVLDAIDKDKVVIKPVMGASAYQVNVLNKNSLLSNKNVRENIVSHGDVIVQPFLKEINTLGEWSFVFFSGEYSHAVIKKPSSDDFRVQGRFGGRYEFIAPSDDFIKQAKVFVDILEIVPSYARVDMIEVEGQLWLMEMELNEPCLFFNEDKLDAAYRFVDVILQGQKNNNAAII